MPFWYVVYFINFLNSFTREKGEKVMEFTITAEMLKPVTDAISTGLTTLVPIGLGVMGAMIGVGLIPRIIYKFL